MTDLKEIRTKLGLNQTEMAARLGISQGYLSRLETGAAAIDKRTQIAIAALGANAQRRIPSIESISAVDASPQVAKQ